MRRKNDALEHGQRVQHYTEMAKVWDTLPGKPEELGLSLANMEKSAGAEQVSTIVTMYQNAHKVNTDAGVTRSLGTSLRGDGAEQEHPFEIKVKEYAAANGVEYNKALAHFAIDPQTKGDFNAYYADKKRGV